MDESKSGTAPIEVERLVARLADHVLGEAELSATQIRAAEILLRRSQQQEDQAGAGEPKREPITEIRNVIVRPRP
jgi:hypothetical protein